MAEYTEKDLENLAKIDPATGKNLDPTLISAEDAKNLALQPVKAVSTPPEGETDEQRVAREAQEKLDAEAEAAKAGRKPAAEVEDKVIRVGGVEKKRSEWLAEFEESRGIDTSSLPQELADGLLNDYIDGKHKGAWQKNLTEKSEELAVQRKEIEASRRQIDIKKQALSERRQRLETEMKKTQELAAKNIKKEDVAPDGELDIDKQFEYQEMKAAQRRLPEIEQELQQLQQEVVHTDSDRLLADIEILQTIYPQLQTSVPIAQVADAIEKQKVKNHPDMQKYVDIQEVADYAERFGLPIDVAAERLIQKGQLISVRESTETMTTIPSRNAAQEALVTQIARNQRGAAPGLPAGGSPARVIIQPKANIAQEMRKASGKAAGGGQSGELTRLNY
jgi:hypothetical protein